MNRQYIFLLTTIVGMFILPAFPVIAIPAMLIGAVGTVYEELK